MRMPWGKYRGRELSQTPDSYLLWVLDHCDYISPTLKNAIEEQLNLKNSHVHPPAPPPWTSLLQGWYRQLALDFHPDRGGTNEEMRAITEAYSRLKKLLGLSPK